MSTAVEVRAASLSDVGRARERNEDACLAGHHTFAVADGLGGHRAGEVASNLALEPLAALDRMDPKAASKELGDAVRMANRRVLDQATGDEDLKGMGTTMTAVVISGDTAHLAHVGDSRCYLIRGDAITRLSHDHTLVARMVDEGKLTPEQAEAHPQRSILTRALGAEREVEVDEARFSLVSGDRLVLCSDGLTAVLSDDEICAYAAHGADLEEICRTLVNEANARGGPDNITAVVVDVAGAPGALPAVAKGLTRARPHRPKVQRRRVPVRPIVWVALVLALAIGGLITVRTVTNRSYYVGLSNGKVAIFQGVPMKVGGAHLSHVQQPTPISTHDVASWFIPRLQQGIRAKSMEDARRIIAQQIPGAPGRSIPQILAGSPSPSPSPSRSPAK